MQLARMLGRAADLAPVLRGPYLWRTANLKDAYEPVIHTAQVWKTRDRQSDRDCADVPVLGHKWQRAGLAYDPSWPFGALRRGLADCGSNRDLRRRPHFASGSRIVFGRQ